MLGNQVFTWGAQATLVGVDYGIVLEILSTVVISTGGSGRILLVQSTANQLQAPLLNTANRLLMSQDSGRQPRS